MWLVGTWNVPSPKRNMKFKIYTRVQKFNKKKYKISQQLCHIDYTLKWLYFEYTGLNKMLFKLTLPISFYFNVVMRIFSVKKI